MKYHITPLEAVLVAFIIISFATLKAYKRYKELQEYAQEIRRQKAKGLGYEPY